MKKPIRIRVSEAVELEGRWDRPEDPGAAIVFCHPHPQARGTMTVPLMEKVTAALVGRGLAVLRFNFRGVGRSTGTWDDGIGEVDDVYAAVTAAAGEHADLPLGLAGWSFGAATSLHWQAREASTMPWVGIAPPVFREGVMRLPAPNKLAPAQRTFVVGDRDQFVTVEQIRTYASSVDGEVTCLPGSDHFFFFREDRVAEVVAAALCAACIPTD
jgi:alpha/beta superfamily hydrolase